MDEGVFGIRAGKDTRKWIEDLIYRQSTGASLDTDQTALLDIMKAKGYYTYEGLIIEATRLFSSGACTGRWDHVMVDEFQDINPVQDTFLRTLSSGAKSVMVIGDPSQAIYGFRGSSPAAFDDFIAEYPSCKTVHLHETYRLSAQVSEASNAFIGRDAVQSTREGMPVSIVRTESPYEFIGHAIESLTGGMSHRGVSKARAEYALSDIAVVVRTIAQASPVMDALGKASIPFDTAYARPLAEVRGIRERIALLVGKEWEHYVKGLGELAMERMASGLVPSGNALHKIAESKTLLKGLKGNVAQRIARIEDSGLFKLPPLDAGHTFYQYARLFGDDTGRFAEFLRLSNDQFALGTEKVHVITAHAAKGLEFPCVFIAGLIHGVFPLAGSPPTEEQNLFYVAMTRASDLLTLVCPVNAASEFVSLIPEQYSEVTTVAAKKSKSSQMILFD
jgi:superfamily I DNA/RNA helicase